MENNQGVMFALFSVLRGSIDPGVRVNPWMGECCQNGRISIPAREAPASHRVNPVSLQQFNFTRSPSTRTTEFVLPLPGYNGSKFVEWFTGKAGPWVGFQPNSLILTSY
jgi:hypothetical protein